MRIDNIFNPKFSSGSKVSIKDTKITIPESPSIEATQSSLLYTYNYEACGYYYHQDWVPAANTVAKTLKGRLVTKIEVDLERELNNKFDPFALLVKVSKQLSVHVGLIPGTILGYVPRKYTEDICRNIGSGYSISNFITRVGSLDDSFATVPVIAIQTEIYG